MKKIIEEMKNKILSKVNSITSHRKFGVWGRVVLIVGFIALFYISLFYFTTNSLFYRYCTAGALKYSKDYEGALKIYEELGDYRRSEEKAYNIHHMLGCKYLEEEDYLLAIDEFKNAGAEDNEYYEYAVGMYCYVNKSYAAAYEQLADNTLYDSAEKAKESALLAAVDYLKESDIEKAEELLGTLPRDYGTESITVRQVKAFISRNRRWLSYEKNWTVDSGVAGAYEAVEEGCKGWEYDVKSAENTDLSFDCIIDDSLYMTVVVNVTFPYYVTYSRDKDVQAMFASYKTVTKRLKADKLSDQIVFDNNTNLLLGEEGGILRYHAEDVQILPEEYADEQVLAVKETTIVFK